MKYDGYTYRFSPYDLVWNNDSYYVVGWSEKHKKIAKFRVDRIHRPKNSEEYYHQRPKDYDIQKYCDQVFMMYDGEKCIVKLKCDNSLMKTIIDRFGEDVETCVFDDNSFIATVEVYISPTFYSWVFNYCGEIKIIEPKKIKKDYQSRLKAALNNI